MNITVIGLISGIINTKEMISAMQVAHNFHETEWQRLLFLLNDMHAWLQKMERSLLYQ